ncbi:hypothetical protein SAMN00790413_04018 [Deinococcus hopiensis KR-140]|uniref:Uncharacterized protein n=1 Tax=Deinococcus hopiensis KR-140 TaxID=695939 RepID=A0A1W1UA83_9DEIO|nr:hypothetical protein SAMN00790413_04018 [Deinococcus hopiensis KR-140]
MKSQEAFRLEKMTFARYRRQEVEKFVAPTTFRRHLVNCVNFLFKNSQIEPQCITENLWHKRCRIEPLALGFTSGTVLPFLRQIEGRSLLPFSVPQHEVVSTVHGPINAVPNSKCILL